jgi:hypothetical protein
MKRWRVQRLRLSLTAPRRRAASRRSYLEFLSTPSVLPLKLLPRVQETIQARGARSARNPGPPALLPCRWF